MTLKIQQIAYHRNGSMGLGFHAVLFTVKGKPREKFLASVFDEPNAVSIIRLDLIEQHGVTFGENSWRCEHYEDELRAAIDVWKVETWGGGGRRHERGNYQARQRPRHGQASRRDLRAQRKAEIEAATLKINADYRDRITAADNAEWAAEKAFTDARSAAASHEWEGKKVTRMDRKYRGSRAWNRTYEEVPIYGVVEVTRSGTNFAENLANWRRPALGVAFVRLLKKDGTPGMKIENLNTSWKLAE